MPPGSPSSKGFRGVLKGAARRVKKVFEARTPATESRTSSPLPPTSLGSSTPRLVSTHGQLPRPAAQSQQSIISHLPAPSTSQPTPSVSLLAPETIQSANTDSGLTSTVKKAGADAWLGLKTTLQVLEKSDVFLTLKPAIAGFLDVVDMFKVGDSISFIPTRR